MNASIHLEHHGAGVRVVELSVAGRVVTRRFGRLGAEGESKLVEHPDDASAARAFAHQHCRLEAKGYWMGRHDPRLIESIRSDPDDSMRYRVYADWLLERGDPRGELIAAMAAGRGGEANALLQQHAVQLAPAWWKDCRPTWRLGFVRQMTCLRCHDPGLLFRLLRHPSMALAQELELLGSPYGGLWGWEEALRGRPPGLRRVVAKGLAVLESLRGEIPELVL